MTHPRAVAALTLFVIMSSACGSDGPSSPNPPPPPPPPPPPSGAITATIDGVAWASTAQVLSTFQAASNTYTLTGAETGINPGRAIVINLMNVNGPGTYALGTALPFRYANVGSGGSVWETSLTPGAGSGGSVTVTTATPTRIVGTFSFTGVPAPSSPNATGTKVVTNGAFDVTIP